MVDSVGIKDWILGLRDLPADEHIDCFLTEVTPGPGPVEPIPDCLTKSVAVYREALKIANGLDGLNLDLNIELLDAKAEAEPWPRTAPEIGALLDLTPPSLIACSSNNPCHHGSHRDFGLLLSARLSIEGVVDPDTIPESAGWGAWFFRFATFDEFERRIRYAQNVIITAQPEIVILARSQRRVKG